MIGFSVFRSPYRHHIVNNSLKCIIFDVNSHIQGNLLQCTEAYRYSCRYIAANGSDLNWFHQLEDRVPFDASLFMLPVVADPYEDKERFLAPHPRWKFSNDSLNSQRKYFPGIQAQYQDFIAC